VRIKPGVKPRNRGHPMETLSVSRTLFGRYELLDRVSAGGMAEVFRARDTERGGIVALKRILPQIAEDEEFIRMFEDEARIASQLEHPHIARTLDFGHVDESYYIAFEFVDGRDLRTLFERAVRNQEHPPLDILLYVFTRIGEGLSYAHSRKDASGAPVSIVHRDVSPQNIVVSYDGDVKLIDFGIAKAAGKVSRTQVGTLKGKFGYMSPEQVRGGAEVDHRADIFSLGICMWELFTLERLFNADNELAVLEKVRSVTIRPPSSRNPDVPAELDRIVLKALAKDVNERYRAAKDLYRDLNHFAQSSGTIATRDEVAQYMRRAFPESAPVSGDTFFDNVSSKGRPARTANADAHADANQETRAMAADSPSSDKRSDLDIFEGLGKKNTARPSSAAAPSTTPPPPPRSSNAPAPAPLAPPPHKEVVVAKRTLLGIPAPGSASAPPPARLSSPAPRSAPPPPPGRGSLPQVVPPPPRAGSVAPPPMSGRPGPIVVPAGQKSAAPAASGAGGNPNLDMDWDDEDEATHIFDKAHTDLDPKADRPRPAAGTPLAPPVGGQLSGGPLKTQTLMGMNAPFSAPPPPPGGVTMRGSAPPPPPTSGEVAGRFARASGVASASQGPVAFPHPPPTIDPSSMAQHATPGGTPAPLLTNPNAAGQNASTAPPPPMAPQISTVPMPMPGPRPPSVQPPAYNADALSQPGVPYPAPPHVGLPHSRMEATQLVRPQASGRFGLVGLGVTFAALCAGLVIFLTMPRTGRIAVNVADSKGAGVNHVEIFVDGKKQCDTAPCIVDQVSAGTHSLKVLAQGYEQPADRTVTVEARKDAQIDMVLSGSGQKSGTGIKVSGNQPGVKLFVDGKEIGPLPQELRDLTPGDHKIRLAGTDRYAPLEKSVIVAKDEMQDLGQQTLKVVKGKATITLGTTGAKVSIVSGTDRREFPTLPIAVDLDTSKAWALEASKGGFQDYHQVVSFDDGQAEKAFNIVLDPKNAPAGQPQAAAQPAAPAPANPAPVAAAPKPVSAPKPAAPPAEATGGDQPAASSTDAFLNINSIPASSVVLDGRPIGNTPKVHVSVTPGAHTVLFVNAEQGLKKQISVSVAAGETKPAIAKLRE
jgi:serine/threonine protein kinase